ncbi:MAG: hypothetical protein QF664_06845 [Dehalococcoidia bacterium]|jgi:voltage-gated potassium channel|nr:hypothetical protein [Dehalococcoidia bacterium]
MSRERRARTLDEIDRTTEVLLLLLVVAVVPLVLAPALSEAFDLSVDAERTATELHWLIWSVFALEVVTRAYLAPQRSRYLATVWFNVVTVVGPFLRPLRPLRRLQVVATGMRAVTTLRIRLSR